MTKIKRYIAPIEYLSESIHSSLEHPDGQICLYKDIKDRIVPDEWPGEYPTYNGWWKFKHIEEEEFQIVEVRKSFDLFDANEKLFFKNHITGRWIKLSETKPEQWGPRIPMVRP